MNHRLMLVALLVLSFGFNIQNSAAHSTDDTQISGKVVNGLRILALKPGRDNNFVIYRGDYVQPGIAGVDSFEMLIPQLKQQKKFPVQEGERAYIKMKKPGTYTFTAGPASGKIKVIEYSAASYTELSAVEAAKILQNTNPLIVDVRTKMEFQQGYIQGANLLPVQVLQQYLPKLESFKNQDIMIYCATGNRSTVASRILIENGFKKVYNLRYGFSDWVQRGFPVVR